MKPTILLIGIGSLLGACAPQMSATWQRYDGQPVPATFQQTLVECRAQAATVGANTPQAVYPNVYMLAAAQNQRNQTLDAVMQGCMSKEGYTLVQTPIQ